MTDLSKIYEEIHILYEAFPLWAKKVEGYMSYPSESDVRLVFKFLAFVEQFRVKGVKDGSNRKANSL